jgi:hypothetical protein
MRFHLLGTFGVVLLGSGCGGGPACLEGSFPGVMAHVTSAADGSPLSGALGEVRDANYRDSLFDLGDGDYSAAQDRAGTYAIHIQREGFEDWDTSRVLVSASGGACSMVTTEHVDAALVPVP